MKKLLSLLLFICCSMMVSAITIVKGPYLQVGTTTTMIIRWETDIASDSKVTYDTTTALSMTATVAASVTSHEVKLTGLNPHTKYYYTIGSAASVLQGDTNNYFVTSPLPGTEGKYRFWATGDCGNNSTNQVNVKNKYELYNGNRVTDGWLLLGDNAYDGGLNSEFNTKFFNIYQTSIMKHAVLWPAPGNHDYNNIITLQISHNMPYYNQFTLPMAAEAGGVASNTEAFYSYDYGNVHFISLDSYGLESNSYRLYDTLGPQAVWLKQDLATNTRRWTVVYFHHPPYTMGSHNSDLESELSSIRQKLLPILERFKVDMVLCGHSHNYERSRMMKGYYGNESAFSSSFNINQNTGLYDGSANSCPYIKDSSTGNNGTVYVVAGSAGQLAGSSGVSGSWPHSAMYASDNTHGGSLVLDVNANRFDVSFLCSDGVIRDHFTMFKQVNKVIYDTISSGQSVVLTASWPGSYSWNGLTDTTRTVTVSPTANHTYWVSDPTHCITDTFYVKVNGTSSIQQVNTNTNFIVYPNPTTGNFSVEVTLTEESLLNISATDVTGKIFNLQSGKKVGSGKTVYHFAAADYGMQPGIYLIQIQVNGHSYTQRIAIEGK